LPDRKRRLVTWYHRHLSNPVMRHLPGQAMLETVGRKSGLPRATPIGGRLEGDSFWLVSDHGRQSQYVRNIIANPNVRVKIRGRWHTGTAVLLPDDDPHRRLKKLPRLNSLIVRLFGTDLLTVRIDLSPIA
jgi:deazaflavin-dependent oxidoreductase (nitroreductase family)